MNIDTFSSRLLEAVTTGTIFQNPGGGTSEVLSIRNDKVRYKRGDSTITISIEDLFSAFAAFRGKEMSSSELKAFSPSVFDSEARPAGHNCNATFLFLVLLRMAVVTEIKGQGVRGEPFFVMIP
ncbi:hypothetical protein [Duganella sp. LjRoot269]|uniref:hypothetical protein n=1 Tax=Duganella sp. LjRoot269 TaxID=3342305 RepID=UPI003ECCCB58